MRSRLLAAVACYALFVPALSAQTRVSTPAEHFGHEIGADLSKLSVGELQELIGTLKAEMARVQQTLADKQSSKSAAEQVFKR